MFLQVIYHATHTCCQNLRLSCYESEVRMSHNCLYLSYISKVVVADVISLNSSEKIWRCIIRNHLTFFSVGSIKLMLKHQTQGIWNFSEINLTPFILCYFKIWIPKLIAYNHRSTLFLKIDVGDTMIHIWKKNYSLVVVLQYTTADYFIYKKGRERQEKRAPPNLLNNP